MGVVFFLIVTAFFWSCEPSVPEPTTPKAAFKRYLILHTRGDYEGLYALLVGEARAQVEKVYENIQRCKEIARSLPEQTRSEILRDLIPAPALEAESPAQIYAAIVPVDGKETLTVTDRLKSNIRKVSPTEQGTVVLTTVSGERSEWIEGGDGRYYRVPDAKEAALLRREFLRSIGWLEVCEARAKQVGNKR